MKRYSLYSDTNGNYRLVYNGYPKLVTISHWKASTLHLALTDYKAILTNQITDYTHEADFDKLSDLLDTHPELYL